MSHIPLDEPHIEAIIPIMNGLYDARITYEEYAWKVRARRVVVFFSIEIGKLHEVRDELTNELLSSSFIPSENAVFQNYKQASFTADDSTWVDPITGNIIKYSHQEPTAEMVAMNYCYQYNWFAAMSDKDISNTLFITTMLQQKIANQEFEIQRI